MKPAFPTWLDPRIEIRESPLHGHGAFASGFIAKGEIVTVWAHSIFETDSVARTSGDEFYRRIDGSYIWLPPSWESRVGYDVAEEYLNHSCYPNVWLNDEVTLAACRSISVGEELTADYALWVLDENYIAPWDCRCGSAACRGKLTGHDWETRELQQRYAGHFHPVMEARIEAKYKDSPV